MSFKPDTLKLDMFPPSIAGITRPADTTQYAADDAMANATGDLYLTFTLTGAANGDKIIIDSCKVVGTSKQTQLPSLELWLFTVAPTGVADNAAFAVSAAEAHQNELATVISITPATYSTTITVLERTQLYRHINLDAADNKLYGLVKVLNAYTPTSAEQFEFLIQGYRV